MVGGQFRGETQALRKMAEEFKKSAQLARAIAVMVGLEDN